MPASTRRKSIVVTAIATAILAGSVGGPAFAATLPGGEPSVSPLAEAPADAPVLNGQGQYEISTPAQLLYLSHNYDSEFAPKDGYYTLTADLDMAGITDYAPFGRFYGTFDGGFHTISNLLIDRPGVGTVGFFTHLGDSDVQAVIKDTAFLNIDVRGGQTTGAVAGMLWGTVENVYTTGSVEGSDHSVGGIAGRIPEDTSGTIPQPDPATAAVPTIRNSYSTVHVQEVGSGDSQGGLAGRVLNPRTIIENSFAAGPVDGKTRVGGLAGDLRAGIIRNSVAAGPIVSGDSAVNSAVGRVVDGATAENLRSWAGMVAPGINGDPVTEEELQQQFTYESLGWDFEFDWDMATETVDGEQVTYPVLRGFGHQSNPFDFTSFSSPVEFTLTSSAATARSITVDIEDVTNAGEPAAASEVAIVQSESMPGDGEFEWKPAGAQVFDGLEPSAKYTFWAKVKLADGTESAWRFAPLFTSYEPGENMDPYDINAAITQDPATTMNLNWTTQNIELTHPVARIAEKGDDEVRTISGTHDVMEVNMTDNEAVIDGIRNFHTVHATGLEPDTTYVYSVGDSEADVWSADAEFTTAVAGDQDFSFLYITDPQVQKDNKAFTRTMTTVEERFPDVAFSYISGDLVEKGYAEGQMDVFFGGIQDSLLKRSFLAAQGNHDRDTLFNAHFQFPDEVFENTFSFDYGDAHFAVLNSEHYSEDDLAKIDDWLRADMDATDKTWRVVMLHRALYAKTDHVDDPDIDLLREFLAPTLEDLGIDAVIMGHDHSFSRGFVQGGADATPTPTMDGGREVFTDPTAPLYIVNGTAGSSKWYKGIQYDASLFHNVAPDYSFIDKSSATYDEVLQQQSFTIVDVKTDGTLSLDTYFFKYDSEDPNGYEIEPYLFDSIELVDTTPGPDPEQPGTTDPGEGSGPDAGGQPGGDLASTGFGGVSPWIVFGALAALVVGGVLTLRHRRVE